MTGPPYILGALTWRDLHSPNFLALLHRAAELPEAELQRIRDEELPGMELLAARRRDELVGFAAASIRPQQIELEYLAVAQDATGDGIGSGLVSRLREAHGGVQFVAHTDDDAVDFYRRLGFRISAAAADPRWPTSRRYRCELPARSTLASSPRPLPSGGGEIPGGSGISMVDEGPWKADSLLAHRTLDTPLGPLLLAATPRGLVRVAFEQQGFDDVVEQLTRHLEGATDAAETAPQARDHLDSAATQLGEYFTGRRQDFHLPLDRSLSTGFAERVRRGLQRIPFGVTRTYRQLAERTGNPKAVRAVGTACASNPLPVIVPCHRVVRSDGGLGGYVGGLEAKRTLLTLEGTDA
ncbi:GNAT family N-acetyltransferase [Rothia sp. BD8]|uniref:GNAT family N-acetyltransferase n=1 Tax=Rothia sp. BD8 TaxID=2953894 RepID=UPI00384C53DF